MYLDDFRRALRQAIKYFKTQAELARQIGATRGQISYWLNEGLEVPLKYALRIEQVTLGKITALQLAPRALTPPRTRFVPPSGYAAFNHKAQQNLAAYPSRLQLCGYHLTEPGYLANAFTNEIKLRCMQHTLQSKALFQTEQKTEIPMRYMLLMLLVLCDEQGYFPGESQLIKQAIMPYDSVDIVPYLQVLQFNGYIRRPLSSRSLL